MFTVLDLFCGTGGLSYGLKMGDARFTTVGGLDIDSDALSTARANHADALFIQSPISQVSPGEFVNSIKKPIDVIVGGPPCQGFSSLRPTRGEALDDPRNHLYKDFIRFVAELQPKAFLMENVVGITSATRGNIVESIEQEFADIGYRTDWRIVNAANFGVPQKRERFIMIGVEQASDVDPLTLFPKPTHVFNGRTIGIKDKSRMIQNPKVGLPAITTMEAISDLPPVGPANASDRYKSPPRNVYQQSMRQGATRLSLHEATAHNEKMMEIMRHAGSSISSIPEHLLSSGYSSSYSRLDPNEPSTTITVKFTSPASSKCIHPTQDRAITPREAARIQSFPDRFEFIGGRTSVASQLGNAVPPLLAAAFAAPLAAFIEVNNRREIEKTETEAI